MGRRGQQQLQPIIIPCHVQQFRCLESSVTTIRRVTADPLSRVVGVSDPRDQGKSLLCHFRPVAHQHAHWHPEQWAQDLLLGEYLCKSAAVLQIRMQPDEAARSWACTEAFRGDDGKALVRLTALHNQDSMTIPMSGYRGVRTFLAPRPVEELATRVPQRMRREQCTEQQWARLQHHFDNFQRAGRLRRELQHAVGEQRVRGGVETKGQQTLHQYVATHPCTAFPTTGTLRPTD